MESASLSTELACFANTVDTTQVDDKGTALLFTGPSCCLLSTSKTCSEVGGRRIARDSRGGARRGEESKEENKGEAKPAE